MERYQLVELIDGLRKIYQSSPPIVEALNEIEAILKESNHKFAEDDEE